MLVLTREIDETVVVGHEAIEVTVVAIRGNKVRLGLNATPGIPLDRLEVWEAKRAERLRAGEELDAATYEVSCDGERLPLPLLTFEAASEIARLANAAEMDSGREWAIAARQPAIAS